MGTYTIGEAAERSGFTASALRYYEGIGLVTPADRTDRGYRLYDDGALARLAFISRAKRLGCSLDEVTGLVGAWDGERCAPVQRQLSQLVAAKLDEARRSMAELEAFTRQLEAAAGVLAESGPDDACGPTCACLRLPDDRVPVACTIGDDEVEDRVALLHRLRAEVPAVERTAHGMLLRFAPGPDLQADVRRFVSDESRCCAFWRFEVVAGDGDVTLRWDGPPAVTELLDRLAGWFGGEEPLPDIRELL